MWKKWYFSYSSSKFTELRADLKLCSSSERQDNTWKQRKKIAANLSKVSKESHGCVCCFWGESERCQSRLLAAASSCKKSVSAQCLHCVSDMMSSLLFFPPLQMETELAGARGS